MFLLRTIRDQLVGAPERPRIGRPANEVDHYRQNWEERQNAVVENDKKDFQDLVGSIEDHTPLNVQSRDRSPNPSVVSLASARSPGSNATEPSGSNATGSSPPAPASTSANASTSVGMTQTQPRSSQPAGHVPVYTLSQARSALKDAISLMGSSDLKDAMKSIFDCCCLLSDLLEELAPSIESAPKYSYAISGMHRDVTEIIRFLKEWSKRKRVVQLMQRKDVHLQIQQLQEICTRHLSAFIAIRQRENAIIMSRQFAELRAKLDEMSIQTQPPMNPENVDQADADVLRQQVQRITGHTPDASYILKGVISYRETVALNTGNNFDVFRGKLKDGQTIAIKLYRERMMIDGKGTQFVYRIMRQVRLWSSFSSPFILQCYGIGMQITKASEEQNRDRFQFYLVSPYMRRGNAVDYIHEQRKVQAYVNILQYIRHAAYGIQYLHQREHPCVHASIRGENVIIKDDDTACLNGFGLTKDFVVGKQIELTGKNFQCRWMAPELLNRDRPELLPSCDIWSWAMTALELITGKEPYYKIESQWQVQEAVVKGRKPERSDYPTFEDYCPQPNLMWALLEKCWATEPKDRPTIVQVIAELENIEKAQIEQQTAPIWG